MQAAIPPLGPSRPDIPDLSDKVAVVTGGAFGIGFEVAKALALHGARVIMVNRKEDQGNDAKAEISDLSNGKARVDWKQCDLGNLKEVQRVFSQIADEEEKLNFLVLASGINVNDYREDHDGIDAHFGVNWLGHFYAVNLLYPLLRKTSKLPNTPAPRIVFEASVMHNFASSDTKFASKEEINDPNHGPVELYGRTKLAMILGAKYGLAQGVIKRNGDNIYALSVHPGSVSTAMQDQWEAAYPGIKGKLAKYAVLAVGRSPEQGAYSALWALTSNKIEEMGWNGYYFDDQDTPDKESQQARDPKLGDALWSLSTKLVEEIVGENAMKSWDA
ncbi:hypothetical protein AA313_de0208853 [Arthrobotrys entomopaga]|nr:hypothetical protein AA313_de0208853 [Arthrobotrys entomopaga]